MTRPILCFVGILALAGVAVSQSSALGPSAYTAAGIFPTSAYQSYYNDPTATSAQPQPVITDPVTHETYPYWLTNPDSIPQSDTYEPHPLPPVASSSQLLEQAFTQIVSISQNPVFGDDTCTRCQAGLEIAKFLSLAAPEQGPNLAVRVCEYFNYSTTCEQEYGFYTMGTVITQLMTFADVGGYDGQSICNIFLGLCPLPPTSPLDLTNWFAKPKPNPLPPPRKATGERLKVLHVSDLHIDPRYTNGAEADCSAYLCCRPGSFNSGSPNQTVLPAPRYGAYDCDAPYSLILAALEAIPILAGANEKPIDFTVFTGDLLSHDPEWELSRQYTLYTETVMYDLLKRTLGSSPVYAVLGNHDTYNEAQASPFSIGEPLENQFSWDYEHVTSMWEYEGWINQSTVASALTHYAAYSVRRVDGLRIITLNTNFCMFLTDELQDAEDVGDRAWIMGHVLSGWDGTNALPNPTNLSIFYGHTHEDEFSIFYTNNATNISADNALAVSWIAPSLTPLTHLNSGFRVYEVDSGVCHFMALFLEADVNSFSALDDQTEYGPTYEFEYNTRETYGANIPWGPNDPLNATWWHLVTERKMEANNSLVADFNTFQGKSSVMTTPCTGDCIPAKICYMRSGSASIALQNCIPGYGSVQ
ncbi:Metallo-dependent phosphatase-like protein [Amylocystis lapponica]|nr:Metallo-dependent phosphatase-like protein [Amylocystis lapponica]